MFVFPIHASHPSTTLSYMLPSAHLDCLTPSGCVLQRPRLFLPSPPPHVRRLCNSHCGMVISILHVYLKLK